MVSAEADYGQCGGAEEAVRHRRTNSRVGLQVSKLSSNTPHTLSGFLSLLYYLTGEVTWN